MAVKVKRAERLYNLEVKIDKDQLRLTSIEETQRLATKRLGIDVGAKVARLGLRKLPEGGVEVIGLDRIIRKPGVAKEGRC